MEEQAELAESFEGKGVEPQLAGQVAEQLSKKPEQAPRLHAQEEIGVDPDELPSPAVAAASSFFTFAVGAIIPLPSYLAGSANLYVALGIAAVALLAAGAVVARLTAVNAWYGAARHLLLGARAAGVTYGVGRAIGTSVS